MKKFIVSAMLLMSPIEAWAAENSLFLVVINNQGGEFSEVFTGSEEDIADKTETGLVNKSLSLVSGHDLIVGGVYGITDGKVNNLQVQVEPGDNGIIFEGDAIADADYICVAVTATGMEIPGRTDTQLTAGDSSVNCVPNVALFGDGDGLWLVLGAE